MPISPETEELIRERWASSIPERFRPGVNEGKGAIIQPPPPVAVFERWLEAAMHQRTARRPAEKGRCIDRLDGNWIMVA